MFTRNNLAKTAGLIVLPLLVLGVSSGFYKMYPAETANAASSDYLLELEGIPGDAGAARGIEIQSWSWGASNSGSMSQGGGLGSGKVSMSDFHFMKRIDKSTPLLMKARATGKHFPKATIKVQRGAGEPLTVTLTDVFVSGFGLSGNGDVVSESVSFTFQKIEFKTASGSIIATYDLKKGTKI